MRRQLLWVAASALAFGLACHEVKLDLQSDEGAIGILDDLYSVSVVNEDDVVAVGYYGAAYYSSDSGETWAKGITGTTLSLYSVSMADSEHGWAVGQLGIILRTEDGARTWVEQPNPKRKDGSHFFSINAIDKDTAVAVGAWGTRIRTSDGGKTWADLSFTIDEMHPQFVWLTSFDQERVRNGEQVFEDVGLNDVYCGRPPSTRCWLIGEFGYLFYSEDQGVTWQQSSIEGSVEIPAIAVGYNELELDEAAVATLGEFARAIASEEHLNVAISSLASSREIAEFGKADDPSELFEILDARAQEVRTVLEDAGIMSDRLRMRAQPPWDYEDFLEDDPEFLNRYLDGRRADSGGIKVRVLQNPYLFTVRFRDDAHGLIAGLGGVILRSDDGGKTWAYRKIDRKQALFSVVPVEGRAVAVGEKGLVRTSLDGGDTWAPPADGAFPEIYTFMRDISFEPSGKVGFIVGQSGQVLRSVDAGYAWNKVLPPESES
ncbi:MAG: YCF48-related protein [Proteobacteria bacterium]|nr:YCF48-related protein [Pseudomonadota bacterium]